MTATSVCRDFLPFSEIIDLLDVPGTEVRYWASNGRSDTMALRSPLYFFSNRSLAIRGYERLFFAGFDYTAAHFSKLPEIRLRVARTGDLYWTEVPIDIAA